MAISTRHMWYTHDTHVAMWLRNNVIQNTHIQEPILMVQALGGMTEQKHNMYSTAE